ncbi:carbohydrate ABC transporter membrane protein 2, CUT1 family [Psychromonas ingrahamii 37]|uniref:Carbohydrate ABC transporter membrane protein 2, CUT1 family n=1 Tax=Psychromonas ingrahamii (strain DSM 17664 / CCUG 51855 / 37) TaxID=357804 RepID=A1SW62_PSYIN|nr:carbohydrate ABC transporter permease [Psychromonas ingrahamii]ABM03727.1 carbohydrate ABC transporter membrane protein 2, CUT1 family [Psychromonas ingrahamii 37]
MSINRVLIYSILSFVALIYLMPLVVMLITSLKDLDEIRSGTLLSLPQSLNFDAWGKAWGTACTGVSCEGLKGYFWNSVLIVVPAVAISTVLGALNGYVLTKWKFKGSDLFFGMLLIGTMIPFQVILLPMARTLGFLGLSGTTSGLIMVHVIYGLAFTTLFFRNYYISIPNELVNAARIDGAGFWLIFWRIIIPVSIPIIVVSVIWQFTQIWNDFLFGVVYSSGDSQPITVALNNLVNTSTGIKEYNVDMAAAIIAALPTLLVYVVAGKYFVKGLTAGAVKG